MPIVKLQSEYSDLGKYKNNIGDIFYYKKGTGLCHNPYGPAIITSNGHKLYYMEGKCHRLDGPAIIYCDGKEEYYINDKQLTKEEFEKHPERLKYLKKEHLICLM